MLNNIKAEFRKILTMRSSYGVVIVCLILAVLFAFYGTGFHSQKPELADPHLLASQATDAISLLGVIGSLVAVLLVTNEYRYNLITYTLTASKTRTQVLPAKIIALSVYAIVFTALFVTLAPLLAWAGLHVHGSHYVSQSIPYVSLAWRTIFVGWGLFAFAFAMAMLIRNQVGALVTAFVFPGVITQLLQLVFRGNSKYLPYQAIDNVLNHGTMVSGKAALVVAVYVVVGWLAAWAFFLRRDAN